MILAGFCLLLGFFLAFASLGSFVAVYVNKLPNSTAAVQFGYAAVFATVAYYLISFGVN